MTKQNTPASIHAGQWEVIDGMARPKQPSGLTESIEYYFEKKHLRNTYPAPGLKGGVYEAEKMQFVYEMRARHSNEWKPFKYKFENIASDGTYILNGWIYYTRIAITATPTEVKEPEVEWWNSLSTEEEIAILKEEGIYGHDQGVTESEIKEFYLSRTITTPTTLLSEGKETVSDDWKDQLIRGSCTDKIQSEDLYIYALGFQRCIEWQSQHTAKEIEALQFDNNIQHNAAMYYLDLCTEANIKIEALQARVRDLESLLQASRSAICELDGEERQFAVQLINDIDSTLGN